VVASEIRVVPDLFSDAPAGLQSVLQIAFVGGCLSVRLDCIKHSASDELDGQDGAAVVAGANRYAIGRKARMGVVL
jgi:hypothetical protein